VEEGEKRSLRRSVEKRCERDFFCCFRQMILLYCRKCMECLQIERALTQKKNTFIWPVWFVHSKSGPAEAEAELAPPLLALVSFHEGLGRCQVAGLHGQFVAGAVDETALGA
jgi:hypothetical protein